MSLDSLRIEKPSYFGIYLAPIYVNFIVLLIGNQEIEWKYQ